MNERPINQTFAHMASISTSGSIIDSQTDQDLIDQFIKQEWMIPTNSFFWIEPKDASDPSVEATGFSSLFKISTDILLFESTNTAWARIKADNLPNLAVAGIAVKEISSNLSAKTEYRFYQAPLSPQGNDRSSSTTLYLSRLKPNTEYRFYFPSLVVDIETLEPQRFLSTTAIRRAHAHTISDRVYDQTWRKFTDYLISSKLLDPFAILALELETNLYRDFWFPTRTEITEFLNYFQRAHKSLPDLSYPTESVSTTTVLEAEGETFAKRLLSYRQQLKLSRAKLARLIEIDSSAIYRLETEQRKKVRIPTLRSLLQVFALPEEQASAFMIMAGYPPEKLQKQ